jgi:hypothetical protein
MHKSSATLLFIRGIPGSGKSFLATELLKSLNNVVLLDPDTIDFNDPEYVTFSKELTNDNLDVIIHPFRWLRKKACESVKPGALIIWNQPFTNRGVFDRLVNFIQNEADKKNVAVHVLVLEVDVTQEVAYERILSRISAGGHGPTKKTFASRATDYVSFEDGYDTLHLDGTTDVQILAKKVHKYLQTNYAV